MDSSIQVRAARTQPGNAGSQLPCRHLRPAETGASGSVLCPHPWGDNFWGCREQCCANFTEALQESVQPLLPTAAVLVTPPPSAFPSPPCPITPGVTAQIRYPHPSPCLRLPCRRLQDALASSSLHPCRADVLLGQDATPLVGPALLGEGEQLEKHSV